MPLGLSAQEIDWLRDSYRMFRDGDPAFMDYFAPDATISVPETLPAGGTYEGPFEALEFWNTIGELFEGPNAQPEELLRVEDRVIVFGTWQGRSRRTGVAVRTPFIHVLRMSSDGPRLTDQKIVAFELFIDTATILNSLAPESTSP